MKCRLRGIYLIGQGLCAWNEKFVHLQANMLEFLDHVWFWIASGIWLLNEKRAVILTYFLTPYPLFHQKNQSKIPKLSKKKKSLLNHKRIINEYVFDRVFDKTLMIWWLDFFFLIRNIFLNLILKKNYRCGIVYTLILWLQTHPKCFLAQRGTNGSSGLFCT